MTASEILEYDLLPETDIPIWNAVELLSWKYACLFDLPLRSVGPARGPCAGVDYGWCFHHDGRIEISIRRRKDSLGLWSEAIGPESIIDTIAHELAHLRHNNHSKSWRKLYKLILEYMHSDGTIELLGKLAAV